MIVGLLLTVDGHDDRLVSSSTLVGIFVAAAVSLVLGSGYARYAEARAADKQEPACTRRAQQAWPRHRPTAARTGGAG